MSEPTGALSGITVLDLTRVLAGPYCTQMLGDLGADVIKIERPGSGDDTRRFAPPFMAGPDGEASSESAYFMSANRNKRSVALNLKDAAAKQALLKLCEGLLRLLLIKLAENPFCVLAELRV